MNKWQQLEEQLKGVFGCATILADGHEVTLQKRLDGERLVIVAYVDGWIKGKWTSVDGQGNPVHPQGRFFRPRKSRAWALEHRKKLRAIWGKAKAEEMTRQRTIMLDPHWNSPKTLISHLKKHFPDLELKSREEERRRAAQGGRP